MRATDTPILILFIASLWYTHLAIESLRPELMAGSLVASAVLGYLTFRSASGQIRERDEVRRRSQRPPA